jgi:hypothetical protein
MFFFPSHSALYIDINMREKLHNHKLWQYILETIYNYSSVSNTFLLRRAGVSVYSS